MKKELEEEFEEDLEENEESDDEEEDHEDLVDVVANQLWRKTVRHDAWTKEPIYLIGEDYIREIMNDYIYDEISEPEECEFEEDEDEDIYSYGGYTIKRVSVSVHS